jgi:hypothetical protein
MVVGTRSMRSELVFLLHAHSGFVRVVLSGHGAGEREPQNEPHQVLNYHQKAKNQDEPEKNRVHYGRASPGACVMVRTRECLLDLASIWHAAFPKRVDRGRSTTERSQEKASLRFSTLTQDVSHTGIPAKRDASADEKDYPDPNGA